MPRRKADAHLFELAKRGAEGRLRELVQEAKNLIGLFPHLRDSFDKDELPLPFIVATGARRAQKRKSLRPRWRRRVSAAARQAISQRMKKSLGSTAEGGGKGVGSGSPIPEAGAGHLTCEVLRSVSAVAFR